MNNKQSNYKQTEIGEIPKDWDIVALKEVVSKVIDNRGKTPPLSKKGLPLIETYQISMDKKFPIVEDYSKQKYVSEETYQNWFRAGHPQPGDILFSTVGASIPQWCLIPADASYCIAQNLIAIRPNIQKTTTEYLRNYFHTGIFRSQVNGILLTTAQPSIKVPHLLGLEIALPPLSEQQQIADIFSSLDDKIELNRKMNKTLEEIGKSLFKRWFVDFEFPNDDGKPYKSSGGEMMDSEFGEIPKGWGVSQLGNVVNIVYGKGLLMNGLTDNGFPVFGGNGIIGYYDKYIYEEPQVIVGCRGAGSGNIKQTTAKSYITNNSLVLEIPKGSNLNRFYLRWHLCRTGVNEYITGSAQPQITIEGLKNYLLLIPPISLIGLFDHYMRNIDSMIFKNEAENEPLSQIRDSLLPRLMSGKLRV